jgi:hypothetical protein
MAASPSMVVAVEAVWRIPRAGPDTLQASPTFIALSELCQAEYGGGKPVFALSTALRSLGLSPLDQCASPPACSRILHSE